MRDGWQRGAGKVHVKDPTRPTRARCGQSVYGARKVDVDTTPPDVRCRTCFPGSTRGTATGTSLDSLTEETR